MFTYLLFLFSTAFTQGNVLLYHLVVITGLLVEPSIITRGELSNLNFDVTYSSTFDSDTEFDFTTNGDTSQLYSLKTVY